MLSHIIVPIDASPAAESVLGRFLPLFARPETEVILVHASLPPLSFAVDARKGDEARGDEAAYVADLAKRQKAQGVRCRGVVQVGPAADVILAAAAERPGGMIAMSTHGRSGLSRLAFGSVAESVLRKSPVPVLMVRVPADDAALVPKAELRLRRILVPVDGSLHALFVAPHVAELAKAFRAEVTLVHVLPPKPATGDEVTNAERVLEAAKSRFKEAGVACETLIRTGDAATEILEVVRERKVDLIACSTHGRSGIARVVMGSVSESLLRTAGVPLLVVRAAV